MDCPTTTLAIDFFVFDIGYYREEEKRIKEIEIQMGITETKKATKGLIGI
jgi:hypothetical protein